MRRTASLGLNLQVLINTATNRLRPQQRPVKIPNLNHLHHQYLVTIRNRSLTLIANLRILIIQRIDDIRTNGLRTLRRLTFFVRRRKLRQRAKFPVRVRFGAMAILIAKHRQGGRHQPSDRTQLTSSNGFMPVLRLLEIGYSDKQIKDILRPYRRTTTRTLDASVGTRSFLNQTIRLRRALTSFTVLSAVPSIINEGAAIALMGRDTLGTLLLLNLTRAIRPILDLVNVN